MSASEFSGNYAHNIDPKGRVTIPSAYREALGDTFTIGLNNEFNAIALYPVEKWEEIGKKHAGEQQFRRATAARTRVQGFLSRVHFLFPLLPI